MKLIADQQYQPEPKQNAWKKLKAFTDARIALGRAGASIPTRPNLEFQLAHAQAKDAVLKPLDVEQLKQDLSSVALEILEVKSQAIDKDIYLKRPDLGRLLSAESIDQLKIHRDKMKADYNVVIIAGDGLSARAIQENAPHFIPSLVEACQAQGWTLAPIVVAEGSRVALGDEVASILNAKMLVMLIGERPGLSSPDSMGIYYTYNSYSGCPDSARNCISNIRSAGLAYPLALQRLIALMQKSKQLGLSGIHLKDEHQVNVMEVQSSTKTLF